MEVTAQVLVITRPNTQYVYVKEEVQTYSWAVTMYFKYCLDETHLIYCHQFS